MRGPIIFACEDGISTFRNAAHATSYAEAIDVLDGVYGEYGWDADGRPIALESRLPKSQIMTKVFCLPLWGVSSGEVIVRELDRPPEPDVLRAILLEFWRERDPARAASLSSSSLEQLVGSMIPFICP